MRSIYQSAALAAVASLALAACGGGYIGETLVVTLPVDPLATVPSATATSVDAVVGYMLNLQTMNDKAESREPVDASAVTFAQSDTTEPSTIP